MHKIDSSIAPDILRLMDSVLSRYEPRPNLYVSGDLYEMSAAHNPTDENHNKLYSHLNQLKTSFRSLGIEPTDLEVRIGCSSTPGKVRICVEEKLFSVLSEEPARSKLEAFVLEKKANFAEAAKPFSDIYSTNKTGVWQYIAQDGLETCQRVLAKIGRDQGAPSL
jgi:hypothetical protein